MHTRSLVAAAIAALAVTQAGCNCGGPALTWNGGCGGPVGPFCAADAGVVAGTATCPGAEGNLCLSAGSTCVTGFDCFGPIVLTCQFPPNESDCPVSRLKYKTDVTYLGDRELKATHDALVRLPLASWRYKADGANGPKHFGFIIDGHEDLPAVNADAEHVDLYGYTSMAVATLKVQQQQIDRLEAQVQALQKRVETCR